MGNATEVLEVRSRVGAVRDVDDTNVFVRGGDGEKGAVDLED